MSFDLTAPTPQKSRLELTLSRIGEAWKYQSRGERFVRALVDYLRSLNTRGTLKVYSYAIVEFFDYLHGKTGQIQTPDHVRRADADEYAKWLRVRDRGLEGFRLKMDPARRMDAAIFDFVSQNEGAGIDSIRKELLRYGQFSTYHQGELTLKIEIESSRGLGKHLACLVETKSLTRAPSISQIRSRQVDVGLSNPERAGLDYEVPDTVFRYSVPAEQRPQGAERASTIATKLSALASLWKYMMQSGENLPGEEEPLLRFNVWEAPTAHAREQAPTHREVTRAKKTPTLELVLSLLGTTLSRTHGQQAMAAAEAAYWNRPGPGGALDPSLRDLRDRALILLMAQMGPRPGELFQLLRKDVQSNMVVFRGKRGKTRMLPMPPAVERAVSELTHKLETLAADQRKRGDSRADTLLEPNAPLIPALVYWGKNKDQGHETGLTRAGIAMMLRRRAVQAGIDPSGATFDKIHPHGLRHVFAKVAVESGTPVNVVQAMLGHASGSTTLGYMTAREPESLMAVAFRGAPSAPLAPLQVAPQAPATRHLQLVQRASERGEPVEDDRLWFSDVAGKPTGLGSTVHVEPEELTTLEEEAPQPFSEKPFRFVAPQGELGAIRAIEEQLQEPLTAVELAEISEIKSLAEIAQKKLQEIYANDWGEHGNRERLQRGLGRKKGQAYTKNSVHLLDFSDAEEEDETEFELEEAEPVALTSEEREEIARLTSMPGRQAPGFSKTSAAHKLNQMFAGKESGLTWWSGTSGKLRPDMPVMSAVQAGECSEQAASAICSGLAALWREWLVNPEKGPTAAAALVDWIGQALEATAQLEEEISMRGGRWVGSYAPWQETAAKRYSKSIHIFREHETSAVLNWFRAVAWSYATTRGRERERAGERADKSAKKGKTTFREQKVMDGFLPPSWYTYADPIKQLPPQERKELLNWIAALTGLLPKYPTHRYGSATVDEIAKFMSVLCGYDSLRSKNKFDRISMAKGATKEQREQLFAMHRKAEQAMAQEVNTMASKLSPMASFGFDIEKRVEERIKVGKTTGTRRALSAFYLQIVRDLFGDEAALDPALKYVARCSKIIEKTRGDVPLGDFHDLFRVDWHDETIGHTEEFKKEFAKKTGTHSECVARRIARTLWEMRKKKRDWSTEQELIDEVKALSAYRVPCPQAMESELLRLLDTREPIDVYEKWKKRREQEVPYEDEGSTEHEIASTFSDYAQFEQAGLADEYTANPGRAVLVPTPVHLMMCFL